MGFFSKILGSNDSQTIVRCDEAEFLIWKYQGGAVKSGTSIIVKDGEVAVLVGSSQTTIEGPANTTASEDLSEVFFINLAGSNVVRFAVPYFGVNDPRYPDLNVPVAVRGSINFNIEDYKGFIRMHRLVGFDMEAFQKKIKDAVIKYVKSVVSNIPTDHSIPVVQMEKKILEIGEILNQYLKQRLAIDFAINVRAVDLNAIEYDADDESYKQLRALTQGQAAEMSQTQHKINMDQMKAQSQLNIDATRQGQAQTGAGYIQNIIADEVRAFVQRMRAPAPQPVELVPRAMFNPNLEASWFAAINAIINNVTMLGILLTGAALIREREHGTIEHLLVMPVTPLEIMLSKIWAMGVVVLVASSFSLQVMVKGVLGITVAGSAALFGAGTLLTDAGATASLAGVQCNR